MARYYYDADLTTGLNDGSSWVNAYQSLATAIAGSFGITDTLWASSTGSEGLSVATSFSIPDRSVIISVNKGTDAYEAGALIDNSTGIITISCSNLDGGVIKFYGINILTTGGDIYLDRVGCKYIWADGVFECQGAGNELTINSAGTVVELYDCTLKSNVVSYECNVSAGAKLIVNNLTFDFPASHTSIFDVGGAGGATIEINNSDFTNLTTPILFIKQSSDGDDIVQINANRVKQDFSTLYSNTIRARRYFDFYSCDIGDGYHYFNYSRLEGDVIESTSVYRTGGATYDGTNGFSSEFQPTSAVVEYTNPLRIELGNYELDLTSGSTLTFHLLINDATAQATALTDSECWLEASYPDNTDNALGKVVSTIATTILTTPATLTASTASWTGEGTFTRKQQIAVTFPTSMSNAPVSVSLCLAKDITAENANEMYVCPNPVIT